jgi:glycosyltransferase involved in cell wall biosynthesis
VPEFSIVVPTFNRPELLARALASVAAQTIGDFECIVVDDGSDAAVDLPPDGRFRAVRQENAGPACAVNRGLREARGDAVIRLDDDDRFVPERLELARDGLRRAPVALCWAPFEDEPAAGRVLDGDVEDEILNATAPHMGATAVRRAHFLELDERYPASEDVEWWLRMSSTPVATVPRVGVLLGRHAGERRRHGIPARIEGSRMMLADHADWFARHRAAKAFRWARIGAMERQLGNDGEARRALVRSLAIRPTRLGATQLARSFR